MVLLYSLVVYMWCCCAVLFSYICMVLLCCLVVYIWWFCIVYMHLDGVVVLFNCI